MPEVRTAEEVEERTTIILGQVESAQEGPAVFCGELDALSRVRMSEHRKTVRDLI